jgi:hypothetical protein
MWELLRPLICLFAVCSLLRHKIVLWFLSLSLLSFLLTWRLFALGGWLNPLVSLS